MTAVFVHVPKTGGVSIQQALGLEQHRNRRALRRGAEYAGLVTFGHELPARLVRAGYLDPTGVFFFAFCRNPYDRAVSLWAHWRREGGGLGFPDWCRLLPAMGWRLRAPQARWTDAIDLGFLGRFETLAADFDRLCDALGVERRPLPLLNASPHRPWREHYDEETAAIVRAQYARDFERFGYDENDYLPDGQ